ncbi:Filament-forming protein [Dimargaris xerosporica]|nr:Filament-forming protein [Dimargaris xerosporica]
MATALEASLAQVGEFVPDWGEKQLRQLTQAPTAIAGLLESVIPKITQVLQTTSADTSSSITAELHTILHDAKSHSKSLSQFTVALGTRLGQSRDDHASEVKTLTQQCEDAKASERLAALTHEQELHTLETQLEARQVSLAQAQQRITALETDLTKALKTSNDLHATISSRESTIDELNAQIRTLEQKLTHGDDTTRSHLKLLDDRQQKVEELTEKVNAAAAKYADAKGALVRAESQVQEAQSVAATAKIQITNLDQEVALLRQQNDWLTQELAAKGEEFAQYRKDKTQQLTDAQATTDQLQSEVSSTHHTIKQLQKRLEDQSSKLEEALNRNCELQVQLTDQEEGFKTEMRTQVKLANLWEKTANDGKTRIQELEEFTQQLQADFDTKVQQWEQEQQHLVTQTETLRQQLAEADLELEKVRVELKSVNNFIIGDANSSVPGTPERASASRTPSMVLSPTAALAGRMQRSGKTFTQVYSDYVAMQNELADEKKETARLRECLDHIVKDIEERAPIFNEQQKEYQRVCQQASALADQLSAVTQEAEQARLAKADAQQMRDQLATENQMLQQQVHDLGRQVQTLLREVEDDRASQVSASGLVGVLASSQARTDTDRVITEQLTTFKNIQELQQQNQRLLRVTRELADRMEREEKEAALRLSQQESQAIKDAEQLIVELRDELKLTKTKVQSYIHERDMLRRLLDQSHQATAAYSAHHARGGDTDAEAFSRVPQGNDVPETPTPTHRSRVVQDGFSPSAAAVPSPTVGTGSVEGVPLAEYPKLLHELQANFDAYRRETGVDIKHMQTQLDAAQREASDHRVQCARAQAQVDFLNERYQMLLAARDAQTQELQDARNHHSQAQQTLASTERALQQSRQDLLDLQEHVEKTKTENANLRAEKSLFKASEQRLLHENESLLKERSCLNDLMVNLLRVQNELERAESEAKRRYEHQTEQLERDLQSTRAKLQEEADLNKSLAFRKDAEAQRYQSRIDQLTTDHQKARESLMAAQTSIEHLQKQVDEVTGRLRKAEDETTRLRSQMVLRAPAAATAVNSATQSTTGAGDDTEAQDGNLTVVRQQLQDAQAQVQLLQAHVDQYKAISAANEEALSDLNATYDEYRTRTDEQLAERAATIEMLRKSLNDQGDRVRQVLQELTSQQTQLEEVQGQHEREKMQLTMMIEDLQRKHTHVEGWADKLKADLRQQSQRTQEAQENYTREVTLHAQDIEVLSQLRDRQQMLDQELQSERKKAEAAETKLAASETSWEGQRQILDKTIADLTQRTQDLEQQNTLLHSHLESVSAQALKIQHNASVPACTIAVQDDANGESSAVSDTPAPSTTTLAKSVDELREVVRYMRRNKEILECQHELGQQEVRRFKQQLDHKSQVLEETRSLLAEERERQQAALQSASQHAALVNKIQELNILRESNTTLRAETQLQANRVQTLEKTVQDQQAQLEPLRERINDLESELEVKQHEIKALEEDGRRWKERTTQILQRYNRIDPVEHDQLQKQVSELNDQLQTVIQARTELETRLQAEQERFQNELQQHQHQHQAQLAEQTTQRAQELTQQLEACQAELTKSQADTQTWQNRTENLRSKFNDKLREFRTKNNAAIEEKQAEIDELKQQLEQLRDVNPASEEAERSSPTPAAATTGAGDAAALSTEPATKSAPSSESETELEQTIRELEQRLAAAQQQVASLSQAAEPGTAMATDESTAGANHGAVVATLQAERDQLQQQATELQAAQELAEQAKASTQETLQRTLNKVVTQTKVIQQLQQRVTDLQAALADKPSTPAAGAEPAATAEPGAITDTDNAESAASAAAEVTSPANDASTADEVRRLTEEIESWKTKATAAEATADQLRTRVAALEHELAESQAKVTRLEQAISDKAQQLDTLTKSLDTVKLEKRQLRTQLMAQQTTGATGGDSPAPAMQATEEKHKAELSDLEKKYKSETHQLELRNKLLQKLLDNTKNRLAQFESNAGTGTAAPASSNSAGRPARPSPPTPTRPTRPQAAQRPGMRPARPPGGQVRPMRPGQPAPSAANVPSPGKQITGKAQQQRLPTATPSGAIRPQPRPPRPQGQPQRPRPPPPASGAVAAKPTPSISPPGQKRPRDDDGGDGNGNTTNKLNKTE